MSHTMPLIFIGHGSPMNAIEKNIYTSSWKDIGESIREKPRAILMLSAHWVIEGGIRISTLEKPEMIYDMYGFPPELYRVKYPALGSKEIAEEIIKSLNFGAGVEIIRDDTRGFDHGVWSVLIHMFPKADIPVIMLSLDYSQNMDYHYALGKKLASLRKQGILLIGSGNIVHNLGAIDWSGKEIYPWALEFDKRMIAGIQDGRYEDILDFQKWGSISRMSQPSCDHLLPLFPLLGAVDPDDTVEFFTPDIVMGSVSMRSIVWKN